MQVQALSSLLIVLVAVASAQDEITRIQTLGDDVRIRPSPEDKPDVVYSINFVPLPRPGPQYQGPVGNALGNQQQGFRNPTLVLLQSVNSGGRLPDGIYYRPDPSEAQTPKPSFVTDLTDVQAHILAGAPVKSPGRQ